MKRALVTGGAGFVGAHIVAQLIERDVGVRVLALPDEPLTNLEGLEGLDVVRGNVLCPDDARAAVAGVDTVFHAAAIYESYAPDPNPMYQVNLRGTFNMLEAARREGVGRVVYTASIVALGRPAPGKLASETTPYEAWELDFPYSRTKHLSMLLAQDFAAWGLDVRIVCPGVVLGPGDRTPTPSGQLILAIARGRAPGYTAGGVSYVDVRDAAAGHLAAAEKGSAGGVYIVTGHNIDNKAFLKMVSEACGRRARPFWIPTPVALAYAKALELAAARRGEKPDITKVFLEYGTRNCYYDNSKARAELGLRFRPLRETVRDAVEYFNACGKL